MADDLTDADVLRMVARGRRRKWLVAGLVVLLAIGVPVAAWFIIDGYWKRRFMAKLDEIRASGEPATWEEVMAERPGLPRPENAAGPLLLAFDDLEAALADPAGGFLVSGKLRPPFGGRRSADLHGLCVRFLRPYEDVLEDISVGAHRDRCLYPPDQTDDPTGVLMPHLSPIRQTVRLFALRAELHAEEGSGHAAAADVEAAYAVGASLRESPFLTSFLVRGAMWSIAGGALERVLGVCELPAADLEALRLRMAAEDESGRIRRLLICERAIGVSFLAESSGARLREYLGMFAGEQDDVVEAVGPFLATPGARWRTGLLYLSVVDDCLAVLQEPVRVRLDAARAVEQEARERIELDEPRHSLLRHLTPMPADLLEETLRYAADLRLARAAVAVELWRIEHGRWPESLEELEPQVAPAALTDPVTGGSLCYVRTDEGVLIYSVGPDGVDDGSVTEEQRVAVGEEEVNAQTCDISFCLFDPKRRGTVQQTFAEWVRASDIIHDLGFDTEELRQMDLTDGDLRSLGLERPVTGEE
jgi:hypothetical protein